ncbi:collagen alpha-3(VI) chain-like [Mytilus trossulus]|uniref:collagen alpha-3(VI) chain-like n=1 Tax=Mytilus trossulus TaxID=6551 RepID=UPI003007BE1B
MGMVTVKCLENFGYFIIFLHIISAEHSFNDIVFAIERSSNVTETEFLHSIDFIYNLTELFAIGQNDTLVSILTFSSSARVEFALNDHENKTSLLEAISSLKSLRTEEVANIPLALNIIQEYILQEQQGARSGANRTIIALVKGRINITYISGIISKDETNVMCIDMDNIETTNALCTVISSFRSKLDDNLNITSTNCVSDDIFNVSQSTSPDDIFNVSQTVSSPLINTEPEHTYDILVIIFASVAIVITGNLIYFTRRFWNTCSNLGSKKRRKNSLEIENNSMLDSISQNN